jgi:hypothetical protein
MRLLTRIEKLVRLATPTMMDRKLDEQRALCQGQPVEEILQHVRNATRPEDRELLDEVLDGLLSYYDKRRPGAPNDILWGGAHGFLQWLWSMQDGWSVLPRPVPRELLLAYRNGSRRRLKETADRLALYGKCPAMAFDDDDRAGIIAYPLLLYRCQDCHVALPGCSPDGEHGGFGPPCPSCGGRKIVHMNLPNWGEFVIV